MYDSAATGISNFKVNALRTVIGNDIYHYSDSSFDVNKNITLRNNINTG